MNQLSRMIVALSILLVAVTGCQQQDENTDLPNTELPTPTDPDTSNPEVPTPTETPTPTPTPTATPTTTPTPNTGVEVCFPGQDGQGHTCFDQFKEASAITNSNYRYKNPYTDPSFNFGNPDQYRRPVRFLELAQIPSTSFLSPYFKVIEFMSVQKGNWGITLPTSVHFLDLIREASGRALKVTSGYRSPGYNQGVGGAGWSRHTYGDGFDIYSSGVSLRQLGALCDRFESDMTIYYSGHVHCDWRDHSLDPGFYGDASDSKSAPSRPDYSSQVSIHSHVDKSLAGNVVTLNTSYPVIEDPEELLHEWTITTPEGEKIESESSELKFRAEMSGTYTIQLNLGGIVNKSETLQVD